MSDYYSGILYSDAASADFLTEQAAENPIPLFKVFATIDSVRYDMTSFISQIGNIDSELQIDPHNFGEIVIADVAIDLENTNRYFDPNFTGSTTENADWDTGFDDDCTTLTNWHTDPVTWDVREDISPSETGWTNINETFEIASSAYHILNDTGNLAGAYYAIALDNVNFTAEFRIKIGKYGADAAKSPRVSIYANESQARLGFHSDGIYLMEGGGIYGSWVKEYSTALTIGNYYLIRVCHTHSARTCDGYLSADGGLSWIKIWTGQDDNAGSGYDGNQLITFGNGDGATPGVSEEHSVSYIKVATGLYPAKGIGEISPAGQFHLLATATVASEIFRTHNLSDDLTCEFSMKLDTIYNAYVYISNGTTETELRISATALSFLNAAGTEKSAILFTSATGAFHTYRIVFSKVKESYDLWVDDILIVSEIPAKKISAEKRIYIGTEGTGGTVGEIHFASITMASGCYGSIKSGAFYGTTYLGSLWELWYGFKYSSGDATIGEVIKKAEMYLKDFESDSLKKSVNIKLSSYLKDALEARIGLPDSEGSPNPLIYFDSSLKTIAEDLLTTYAGLTAAQYSVDTITGDFDRVDFNNTTVAKAIAELCVARAGIAFTKSDGKIYIKDLNSISPATINIRYDTNMSNFNLKTSQDTQSDKVIIHGPEFVNAGYAPITNRSFNVSTAYTYIWTGMPVPVTGKCISFDTYIGTAGDFKLKFFRKNYFTDQITWAVLDDDCSSLTGWNAGGSDGGTFEVVSGAFHIKDDVTTNRPRKYKSITLNNSNFTAEIKVKIGAYAVAQADSPCFQVYSNTSACGVCFHSDGIYLWSGSWTKRSTTILSVGSYYYLRVLHTHAANTCDAWLSTDGFAWTKIWTGQSDTANDGLQRADLFCGNTTTTSNAEFYVDYLKVISGLYAPTITYVGGSAAITLKAGLNKDVQVDPPIQVQAGDIVAGYGVNPATYKWGRTGAAGGVYYVNADVTTAQTTDYYTYAETVADYSIRPKIQVEPPIYAEEGTSSDEKHTRIIEADLLTDQTIATDLAKSYYDVFSALQYGPKITGIFLPSIEINDMLPIYDPQSGFTPKLFRVTKNSLGFKPKSCTVEALATFHQKVWTTQADFSAGTLTNISSLASGDIELSGVETAGTALLELDSGVGNTAWWLGQTAIYELSEIKDGETPGWIETTFASETTKSNIDVVGGTIQLSQESHVIQDDFTTDNIDPNGSKIWLSGGSSLPIVSGGKMTIAVSAGNYGTATYNYSLPLSSIYDGYAEVDIITENISDGDTSIVLLWAARYETTQTASRSYLKFTRSGSNIKVWVYTGDSCDDHTGAGDFTVAYNTTPKKFKIEVSAGQVDVYVDTILKKTRLYAEPISVIQFRVQPINNAATISFDNFICEYYTYYSSGYFETITHNYGNARNFETMTWDELLTAYGSMTIKTETKAADAGWDLANADTVTKNLDISTLAKVVDGHQYQRVKIYLSTSNVLYTPILNSFTVNVSPTSDGTITRSWATSNNMTDWSAYGTDFSALPNSRGIRVQDVFTSPDSQFSPKLSSEAIIYTLVS